MKESNSISTATTRDYLHGIGDETQGAPASPAWGWDVPRGRKLEFVSKKGWSPWPKETSRGKKQDSAKTSHFGKRRGLAPGWTAKKIRGPERIQRKAEKACSRGATSPSRPLINKTSPALLDCGKTMDFNLGSLNRMNGSVDNRCHANGGASTSTSDKRKDKADWIERRENQRRPAGVRPKTSQRKRIQARKKKRGMTRTVVRSKTSPCGHGEGGAQESSPA